MDNIAALGSSFESNNDVKITIGNTLDKHESLFLYCPFKGKKPLRKELSEKMIKKIEKKERQPFYLYLRIYNTSKKLFDSEYEVQVDGDWTIDQITRMCFNEEVASKIHVRH